MEYKRALLIIKNQHECLHYEKYGCECIELYEVTKDKADTILANGMEELVCPHCIAKLFLGTPPYEN